jgi:hypothetical protein
MGPVSAETGSPGLVVAAEPGEIAEPVEEDRVKVTQIDPFLKLEHKMNRICKNFTI